MENSKLNNMVTNKSIKIDSVGQSYHTIIGLQNQVWGIPSSLKGQMSSFVLFNESLPAERILELALPGQLFLTHAQACCSHRS